jgi:hypothetical protein
MLELVEVELLARVSRAAGGSWNPGEVAGFTSDEAAGLVRRGLARVVEKAPAGPTVDRMVKGAPIRKGI